MRAHAVCGVRQGDPPLSFEWDRDGVPLTRGVQAVSPFSSVLSVDALALTDAGDYTCGVRNSVAWHRHTARLVVRGEVWGGCGGERGRVGRALSFRLCFVCGASCS